MAYKIAERRKQRDQALRPAVAGVHDVDHRKGGPRQHALEYLGLILGKPGFTVHHDDRRSEEEGRDQAQVNQSTGCHQGRSAECKVRNVEVLHEGLKVAGDEVEGNQHQVRQGKPCCQQKEDPQVAA